MNCGRSSSVEWKLPKLQRRVRFPSPAPPPPGYAPGGFVMPPRQARLACRTHFGRPNRYKTLPTHAPGRRYRYKTLPARSPRGSNRYKTLPARPKTLILAHFSTYYASRENFVPHAGPMPVQNSPRSQPSRVEPVQNSPRTPKMAHFSTYYASRENFIPLPPPTGRAGRKKSRTNTPPHPPTRPSPNFACNSIA